MFTLLVISSLLDAAITTVGLKLGFVELNRVVLKAGLGPWTLFRVALLSYLITVFLLSYQFFKKRSSSRALKMLKTTLFLMNIYIGAVVFSGIFSILSNVV